MWLGETDRLAMKIAVDRDIKPQTKQTNQSTLYHQKLLTVKQQKVFMFIIILTKRQSDKTKSTVCCISSGTVQSTS